MRCRESDVGRREVNISEKKAPVVTGSDGTAGIADTAGTADIAGSGEEEREVAWRKRSHSVKYTGSCASCSLMYSMCWMAAWMA